MQRVFTYERKRRKAPDASDVHLPGAAQRNVVQTEQKAAIVIPVAIKFMPALKSAGIFCYGDEENARRACTHEYLTTANQSEIRKAYLDSE